MGLQRHVAEILQGNDAELVGMAENRRRRQWHLAQQPGHVGERHPGEFDRPRMDREHKGRTVGRNNPEVPSIGGVARQRHDAGILRRQPALFEIPVDAIVNVQAVGRLLLGHRDIARTAAPSAAMSTASS